MNIYKKISTIMKKATAQLELRRRRVHKPQLPLTLLLTSFPPSNKSLSSGVLD
jgi:hypothetical protein